MSPIVQAITFKNKYTLLKFVKKKSVFLDVLNCIGN